MSDLQTRLAFVLLWLAFRIDGRRRVVRNRRTGEAVWTTPPKGTNPNEPDRQKMNDLIYRRVWNEHENDDWPGQYEYQKVDLNIEAATAILNHHFDRLQLFSNFEPDLPVHFDLEAVAKIVAAAFTPQEDTE